MKTFHIIVANKVATYLQRDGYIVCGNSDYQVEFTFDDEWKDYNTKTVRFIWNGKYKDVEVTGSNIFKVPVVDNTEKLTVGVYVEGENMSTTTPATIPCQRSILCGSNLIPEGTVVVPEGTPVLIEKTIIENGEYPAKNYGADGFSKVKINVPTKIPEGYIKPTGTKAITENGTHDVAKFASVAVNVPTGSGGASVGEWVAGTVYNPGDIVIYNGIYYICIATTQAGEAENYPDKKPTEWKRLNGSYKGEYVEGTSYSIGDIVTVDGSVYQANIDEPQSPPDNDMANHWTVIHECGGGTNSALPIEVSTEDEMTALLTSGEVGGVYKYIGASGIYENGSLYVLEEGI